MSGTLVVQTLALGDLLFTTPLVAGLKKTQPEGPVYLLADRDLAPVALAQPDLDRFIPLPRGQMAALANAPGQGSLAPALAVAAGLAEELPAGVDLVYNPCFNDLAGALTRLAEPRRVVGADLNDQGGLIMRGDWPNYLQGFFNPPTLLPLHVADAHRLALGLMEPTEGPLFRVGAQARAGAADLLAGRGVGSGERLLALHPGVGQPWRRWPLDNFIQVGRELASRGWRLLITGSEREKDLTRGLSQGVGESALDLGGATDLEVLAALLSRCAALISNDSGPVHLAAGVGCPVVSIVLAQGNFRATGPYLPGALALTADMDCAPCPRPRQCSHLNCHQCISPADVLAGLDLLRGGTWQRPPGSRAQAFRARRGGDGWLDWEGLTHPRQDGALAAWRKTWLAVLRPGGGPPRPPALPSQAPAQATLARLDELAAQALRALAALAVSLNQPGGAASSQRHLATLKQVEGEFRSVGMDDPLSRPLALYYLGRRGGLPGVSLEEQIREQSDLFTQLRVLARALDNNLSSRP